MQKKFFLIFKHELTNFYNKTYMQNTSTRTSKHVNIIQLQIHMRGKIKKFCDLTIKSTGSDVNYSPLFNMFIAEFDALMSLFCKTVYASKTKLLCLSFHHRLHFMIVRIADTPKKIFQILKQIIVTVRHFCVQGNLIVRSQSHEQLAG